MWNEVASRSFKPDSLWDVSEYQFSCQNVLLKLEFRIIFLFIMLTFLLLQNLFFFSLEENFVNFRHSNWKPQQRIFIDRLSLQCTLSHAQYTNYFNHIRSITKSWFEACIGSWLFSVCEFPNRNCLAVAERLNEIIRRCVQNANAHTFHTHALLELCCLHSGHIER